MTHPVPQRIGTAYHVRGSWAAGYHTGQDYLSPNGTTAIAVDDGKVVYSGWYGWGRAYGLTVILEHVVNGVTYQALYAHCQSTLVKTGQTVRNGQAVAKTNNTGNTTGPHLHFEVRHYPYRYGDDVNPSVLTSAPASVPSAPKAGTATTFDVSFWNIASPKWYTPWRPREADIIREIRGQEAGTEASVWGFAEIYSEEQARTLDKAFNGKFERVPGRAGLEFWYNPAYWVEERPGKSYASGVQGRYALVTHLTRKATGQHVAFVTIHGPVTYDSLKTKYGQWLVKLLGQIDGPIVLMGDANRSVETKSPRKEIRAAGFRDFRELAAVENESAYEFPSKKWNLSDIWIDTNDKYDDKITGGEVDLTTAKPSDHRRIEARVRITA